LRPDLSLRDFWFFSLSAWVCFLGVRILWSSLFCFFLTGGSRRSDIGAGGRVSAWMPPSAPFWIEVMIRDPLVVSTSRRNRAESRRGYSCAAFHWGVGDVRGKTIWVRSPVGSGGWCPHEEEAIRHWFLTPSEQSERPRRGRGLRDTGARAGKGTPNRTVDQPLMATRGGRSS